VNILTSTAPAFPNFLAFTICSRNFLAQAQLLHDGLRRHHPGIIFYVLLCDDASEIDCHALPFEILTIHELGIPGLDGMVEHYNITELNTAIKPFGFLALFDRHPGAAVAYFDPDILVASRLEEFEAVLRDGADCVLTPHLCEPAEFAEMDDGKMLQYGIYNLGFCALRDTPEVRRVAEWWARRLRTHCVIDLAAGLFVDQKWADLLPAFVGRTSILRHPGYNVAYWNLSQRTVRATDIDGNPGWEVNGAPLRFFHFSGSVVDEPAIFSRHSQQFRADALRDVARLFKAYCVEVEHFGRHDYRVIPYAFNWNGAASINLHTPKSVNDTMTSQMRPFANLPLTVGTLPSYLPLLRARSQAEMSVSTVALASKIARRRAFEADLIPHGAQRPFRVKGRCVVCGKDKGLQVGFMYAGGALPDGRAIPNWREHLDCPGCGFVNRIRASMHVLFQEVRPNLDARIYLTEQLTPLHGWLRKRFANLVGSEYLGSARIPGEIVEGVRHEDIQRLSFPDESLDLILSFDVLEHVPDERRALAEFARCLRPGGTLLFTVPFQDNVQDHEVRAILRPDGTLQHLMEPEYHGNPVDPEGGSLCFRYFGWQLMDDLRAAGLEVPEGLFYWSASFAYLGPTNSIFMARKPG
jgi:SAM-dependent methyltransferase